DGSVATHPATAHTLIENDHHLATCFVFLHDAMGFADFVKREDASRLCLEATRRHVLGNFLERDVGEREARGAEDEAAEEGQVDAAGYLQEGVKFFARPRPSDPAGEARAPAATQYGE